MLRQGVARLEFSYSCLNVDLNSDLPLTQFLPLPFLKKNANDRLEDRSWMMLIVTGATFYFKYVNETLKIIKLLNHFPEFCIQNGSFGNENKDCGGDGGRLGWLKPCVDPSTKVLGLIPAQSTTIVVTLGKSLNP